MSSIYERITIEEAKQRLRSDSEPPWSEIDEGIRPIVKILFEEGIETYESCQGGVGHCFPEATVRFHGGIAEGWKAVYVALTYGLRPTELRRVWPINDHEPTGPGWELTFHLPDYPDWHDEQRKIIAGSWCCQRCRRVYAPSVTECGKCNGETS